MRRLPVLLVLLLVSPVAMLGQTFRGTLSGTVVDAQGNVLPNATLELTNPATGTVNKSTSNSVGDFNFPELIPGKYTLSVASPGFQTKKLDSIDIHVTKVTNLKVELAIGAANTVIEVGAADTAVQTDTTSSALVGLIDSKAVSEIPLNGRDFTQLVKLVPGANALTNSVNGARTTAINFQVDGTDNVDNWNGIVASNQGVIAGVAGGLIPIEAIDQFSIQAGGEADQGRNAGATQNMVIKSGTNKIHGDTFYFDRNEMLAAISPVAPEGSSAPLIRNHQGGFTLGGPLWKDHTFLFLAGEFQVAKIKTSIADTVLTDAWIADVTPEIALFKDPATGSPYGVNTLSKSLYDRLFPSEYKSVPGATLNNIVAANLATYNSYNGIIKLDHDFSSKQHLSVRYLGTTGTQVAPIGSYYAEFFQKAPMHVHNFSVVHNYIFSPRVLNQLTMGVNYFLQTFNDADQNYNPDTAGLNVGLTAGTVLAAGSPTITISNFDYVGATQPLGRIDTDGHITDNLHVSLGRHDLKFGGQFTRAHADVFYFSNVRGTFTFDGTAGPWTGTTNYAGTVNGVTYAAGSKLPLSNAELALADYLTGQTTASGGAKLLIGNTERTWLLDTDDLWAQDNFKIAKRLNLNLGARYTIPGAIRANEDDIYQFIPGSTPGFYKQNYPNYYRGIAPRAGFSYDTFADGKTVVRGSWGIFYDFPAMRSWVQGSTTNGGAQYAQNNPAGADAAATYTVNGVRWATNVNPFSSASAPQVGAFGVNQDFKMPHYQTVSFNVEQQLSQKTLFTLGYVGNFGKNLQVLLDLNQAPIGQLQAGTTLANARPYQQTGFTGEDSQFTGKKLLGINQLNFAASSNYSALQASLKQSSWKGISGSLNYTWGKALDNDSTYATAPMNSYNLNADYGRSTFDVRNVLNGYVYYSVPKFTSHLPRLTQGYQLDALLLYSSGTPLAIAYSTNVSGTNELHDRPNYTGVSPLVGGVQSNTSTSTARTYKYLVNNASNPSFVCPDTTKEKSGAPATCTSTAYQYGNLQRDFFSGPSFHTVDFSVIKHTPITERVSSEFRVEIFNIFNLHNFANPTTTPTSSTFGIITNTRNAANAPGIGSGEPFNIQLAGKISF